MRAWCALSALISLITFIVPSQRETPQSGWATGEIPIAGESFFAKYVFVPYLSVDKNRECAVLEIGNIGCSHSGNVIMGNLPFYTCGVRPKTFLGGPLRKIDRWQIIRIQGPSRKGYLAIHHNVIRRRLTGILEFNLSDWACPHGDPQRGIDGLAIVAGGENASLVKKNVSAQLSSCCAPHNYGLYKADYEQGDSGDNQETSKCSNGDISDVYVAYKFFMQPFIWTVISVFLTVVGYFLPIFGYDEIDQGRRVVGIGLIFTGVVLIITGPIVYVWGWLWLFGITELF
jgi:hypothetical protein